MTTGKFEAIPEPLIQASPVVLAGDSTLMFGLQPQWVFLVDARPVGMLPRDNPVVVATQGFTWGADSFGYVLATRDHRAGMPTTHGDSTAIVRVSRTTAEQDTLGWLGVDPRPEPDAAQSDPGANLPRLRTSAAHARRMGCGPPALIHPASRLADD